MFSGERHFNPGEIPPDNRQPGENLESRELSPHERWKEISDQSKDTADFTRKFLAGRERPGKTTGRRLRRTIFLLGVLGSIATCALRGEHPRPAESSPRPPGISGEQTAGQDHAPVRPGTVRMAQDTRPRHEHRSARHYASPERPSSHAFWDEPELAEAQERFLNGETKAITFWHQILYTLVGRAETWKQQVSPDAFGNQADQHQPATAPLAEEAAARYRSLVLGELAEYAGSLEGLGLEGNEDLSGIQWLLGDTIDALDICDQDGSQEAFDHLLDGFRESTAYLSNGEDQNEPPAT